MPPKLTVEQINKEVSIEGYICTDYNIVNKKFNYVCNEGHTGAVRLDHWRRGVRCSKCSGNRKLTLDYVKNQIEKEGYTLLSTEYVNSKSLLKVICNNGHEYFVTYNNWITGYRCARCFYLSNTGENNPSFKGGITKDNLPLYETFANKLEKYQPVHKVEQDGLELLGVECAHCKKIFVPSRLSVTRRLVSLHKINHGDQHMYCSDICKYMCPIYGRIKYFKYQKSDTINNRFNQSVWSNLVKERDNHTCQKCGTSDGVMIAHHIDPVVNNPIESLDLDNGITLCKTCHKEVHKIIGCNYSELRC